ncbi:hypothetical protein [Halalkalibacterium ligniniphilum]|uniref:hypothetical protein n=1 Tax=Halalkalibacterium ligniniphilum TaxID=1134413 RepID=UPI00034DC8D6|nr:hypothetical protein [Halalkalibacterium ligniniphilum]
MTINQIALLNRWIQENRLVTVHIHLRYEPIIGRILSFEAERNTCLIYDDDLKEVHHLSLKEITSIQGFKEK